eukprot:COSAG06_NODE_2531_length_6712_cov_3.173446_4_plen_113_part_00
MHGLPLLRPHLTGVVLTDGAAADRLIGVLPAGARLSPCAVQAARRALGALRKCPLFVSHFRHVCPEPVLANDEFPLESAQNEGVFLTLLVEPAHRSTGEAGRLRTPDLAQAE